MNDEVLVNMAKSLERAQKLEKIAEEADKKRPRKRSKSRLRKE